MSKTPNSRILRSEQKGFGQIPSANYRYSDATNLSTSTRLEADVPKFSADEMLDVLRAVGLEKAVEGVVFPWGMKIVDFEGKKLLQAMSPEEYRKAVEAETGRKLSHDEISRPPDCVYASGGCVSQGCLAVGGKCSLHSDGIFWYCLCGY